MRAMRALLVDPSLFTAPYDAALTEGLVAAGVEPTWAVRPIRPADRQEIPAEYAAPFFYRHVDQATFLPSPLRSVAKGLAHAVGLAELLLRVRTTRPDVVHFQWVVVPPLDVLAMKMISRLCPVVLTVHDTVPFNGDRPSVVKDLAFDVPIRFADRVIVHTQAGKGRLLARGVPAQKLVVIPHGPLRPPPGASSFSGPVPRTDDRLTFVMFGEIKRYKGPDLVVEALGLLHASVRAKARVIIAGRSQMELAPLRARITELNLEASVEIRDRRLSDQEMADLFAETDCFLFPYRQVDASGVYFLTKSLGKWIIASRVGIFAEDVAEGTQGTLIGVDDPRALADAMATAIAERPVPAASSPSSGWAAIGRATRQVYEDVVRGEGGSRPEQDIPSLPDRKRVRAGRRSSAGLMTTLLAAILWLSPTRAPAAGQAVAAPPASPVGFTSDSGYHLVKNWDFKAGIRDESSLRKEFFTRFVYANGALDHLNDEWSRYRDHGNHVFTPEGLALTARLSGPLGPGNVESGMLRSQWTGRYGVYEIRMKVPAGKGLWPAFWLNPEDQTWPPEIDVVEIVNNGRDTTKSSFHFLHSKKTEGEEKTRLDKRHAFSPGGDYADGFHVFAVEWTPDRVRHLVDGAAVADRQFSWIHDDGRDAGPAHVLVNLAVGGKWPGPPEGEKTFPAALEIEYLRVWQR